MKKTLVHIVRIFFSEFLRNSFPEVSAQPGKGDEYTRPLCPNQAAASAVRNRSDLWGEV